MSVRALRHDKRCGRFSKSRGLSASVSFLSSPPPPRLLAPFFARSLLGNSTETLATQARESGTKVFSYEHGIPVTGMKPITKHSRLRTDIFDYYGSFLRCSSSK